MFSDKIENPTTKRQVRVRGWHVNPREIVELCRQGKSAKDISWHFLEDRESVKTMERQLDGEAASSNFALGVLEQALDWRLGLTVLGIIRDSAKRGKMPKPFDLLVSRKGDIFIRTASGQLVAWS